MLSGQVSPDALFAQAPLRPIDTVGQWGTTLIIAPHPDDESLGCGGAIAALRKRNIPVYVLFISDGTMSHPNSKKYPAKIRRALREKEALDALSELGVDEAHATFLRLPDTKVPDHKSSSFVEGVAKVYRLVQQIEPQTVLVPWRRDPHCDHRASWELTKEAVARWDQPLRWLEYPIWVWELAEADDIPRPEDGALWRLSIQDVLHRKQKAIAAHVSQTTRLIDDDPEGFILTPEVLAHFNLPYEIYLEHA
uniref:PIG-L family deacetylase n=1 Tax=Roseihalotalea indica TaxID=2867963 RepID=A0AA49GJN1_9BACT|nr:PIG-L family deacetylase [Tunicatimonas sp. TK19036]